MKINTEKLLRRFLPITLFVLLVQTGMLFYLAFQVSSQNEELRKLNHVVNDNRSITEDTRRAIRESHYKLNSLEDTVETESEYLLQELG